MDYGPPKDLGCGLPRLQELEIEGCIIIWYTVSGSQEMELSQKAGQPLRQDALLPFTVQWYMMVVENCCIIIKVPYWAIII